MTLNTKLNDHVKSVTKSVTYHTLSGAVTFILAWLVTGELAIAGSLMGVEFVAKSALYYAHERIWALDALTTWFSGGGKGLVS
jgi:uncharacterized membrane protein